MASPALIDVAEGRYRLDGDVNLNTVSNLAEASRVFTHGSSLVIDLSGVNKPDSGTLVLLLNWYRYAARHDIQLEFSSMPKSLVSLLDLYDLGVMFKGTSINS